MTIIQESSNSVVVNGDINTPVEAILNISALSLVSIIITSDQSLTGTAYDVYVSNSNNYSTWHYLRSVQCTGNLTTNSYNIDNQSIFANILSFNAVKVSVPAVPNTTVSIVISGR